MKRKVIPLFLMLSCCSLYQVKASLLRGISISPVLQEEGYVSGTVLNNSTGRPIEGVTVVVKATGKSTKTDVSGKYRIQVPYGEAVITFSSIGFQPQQIALNGRTLVQVSLVEDVKALEDVVVVGYTTQKKRNVVGAVSTITTKDLIQSPAANINNMLAGRLPGLIVNQYAGGEPGVDRSELLIRGKSTYGNQSPIIIVDGIERDMSYLAPDEIETVSILKDASATAPYGIRGANGVIVVTTKRGQSSDKASVNFRASYGINSAAQLPELLGSADYATLYNEAMTNDAKLNGSDPSTLKLFSAEAINNFRKAKGDNSDGLGYNWDYFDYIFRAAPQHEYNLSIRGGNDVAKYFVMGGFMGQDNNYDHVDLSKYNVSPKFQRYNFRSNIDVNITKNLWVKLNLGARITDRTSPGTSASRLTTLAMTQPPYLPIVNEPNAQPSTENYLLNNPSGLLFGNQIYRYNVLGELTRSGYHTEKNTVLEGSFAAGWNLDFLTKGLSVDGVFSYDAKEQQWLYRQLGTYSEGYREYPSYATFQPVGGIDVFMNGGHYEGLYTNGNKFTIDQTLGNTFTQSSPFNRTFLQAKINYNRSFNDKHTVASMLLFNRSSQSIYDAANSKAGVDIRYQGLTGQFTYNYSEKYLGEFNFGYNGSENFIKGKRFGFFPAGAVGWVVSKEKFMDGMKDWLSFLKVRASMGLVGNDKMPGDSRFGYLAFYGGGDGYSFGDQNFNNSLGGAREGRLANENISWEKSRKTNIGLDMAFMSNKVNLNIDVFEDYRYDIITELQSTDISFPGVVGKSSPLINIGKVRNRGIDIELSYSDMIGDDFRFFVKPNFTFARNKLIYRQEIPREYSYRQATGKRLYENFLYQFDHFVKDQAEADQLNSSQYQPWGKVGPGDVVYKDLNGDGKITDLGDRTVMGNPRSPEIQFGVPITLQYKGIDFSLLFQGALNSSIVLKDAAAWDFPNFDQDKFGSVRPIHLGRWTPETAETATYPALHMGNSANNKNSESSLFLYDAKYLRLKNIEIGYNFPKQMLKRIGLNQLRIYAQGMNLLTWSGLKDLSIDPEMGNASGYWYPISKIYNFGLNLNF
ncbi:TonB-dependent receptor [Sphingobacterium sp. JUb56]|uniref:SusC/RagA family TonB-linked outer membrane protein n=1 Tax=Sphingobacterium sp. JUb56 TaxID=2587145 RepID=UPI00181F3B60|nr:TonB-dependent receptor [Sphingobacterium sp. JUb56]MBB2954083.1 TonB-linked SusC/RagA family outer membrane protein [Sphingobacterium sp. JUb56]